MANHRDLIEHVEYWLCDGAQLDIPSEDAPASTLTPQTAARLDEIGDDFRRSWGCDDPEVQQARADLYDDPEAQAEFVQWLGENGLLDAE